jgi:hypothetical protein
MERIGFRAVGRVDHLIDRLDQPMPGGPGSETPI